MPVQEHITLKEKKKNPWVVACIAIIAALAVALGGLAVYTVLTLNEQERIAQGLQDELNQTRSERSQLESDLSQKQQELEQKQEELNKKQEELEQNQADASAQIADRDKTIQEQQSTIEDLKEQIALKNGSDNKPPQNLPPVGEYGDYAGQKIVALTFDDGPGPYTERLLDELKKRGVRATFFVLGTRVDNYPDLIKRMAAEGHVVGNHSNSHKMLHKMSLAQVRTEMELCATKIEKLLGYKPPVMRCPGGNCSNNVKQYAKDAGVPILYWGVDTRDWESRNVNSILKVSFGKNGVRDGSIVLMHDIYSTTVDAALQMIDRLTADGYVFVTVPEMLHARYGGIEPGKVYV